MAISVFTAFRNPSGGRGIVFFYEDDIPSPLDPGAPTPPGLGAAAWDWGTPCPGTVRLSWAILAAFLGEPIACCLAYDFAREVLSKLPTRGWILSKECVERWLCQWIGENHAQFRRHGGDGGQHVLPF